MKKMLMIISVVFSGILFGDATVWVCDANQVGTTDEWNFSVCADSDEDVAGAFCLGIIEKGETDHGLAMGQAVVKTILELQLVHDKPIGLGIIGPGAQPEHIKPRLGPHATAAVDALIPFL